MSTGSVLFKSKRPQNMVELEELIKVNIQLQLNDTLIHLAVGNGLDNEVQDIVNNIKPRDRLSNYLVRNRTGFTVLDEAVYKRSKSMSERILSSLENDEQRMSLLQSENKRGWTALHRAVYLRDDGLLKVLLTSVKPALRKALALKTDSCGGSFLLLAVSFPDIKTFKCILRTTDERAVNLDKYLADRRELLTWKDSLGNTILHNIVIRGNVDLLQSAVRIPHSYAVKERSSVKRQDTDLLKSQDRDGRTPLHLAVENADPRMVRNILDLLDSGQKFDLLWATDNRRQSALHYVVRSESKNTSGRPSSLELLMHAVTPAELIMLLAQQDITGNKAMDEAMRVGNTYAIGTIARGASMCASTESLWKQHDSDVVTTSSSRDTLQSPPPVLDLMRPIQPETDGGHSYALTTQTSEENTDEQKNYIQPSPGASAQIDPAMKPGTLTTNYATSDTYMENVFTPISTQETKAINNSTIQEERVEMEEAQISEAKEVQAVGYCSSNTEDCTEVGVQQMDALKAQYGGTDDDDSSTMYAQTRDRPENHHGGLTMSADSVQNIKDNFRSLHGPGDSK